MLTIRTPIGDEAMDLDEFEARVRAGEVRPDTLVLFPAVAGDRWIRAGDLEVFRGLYDPARIYFTRSFSLSRFPRITSLVILANLALFVGMVLLYPDGGAVYSAAAMVELGAKAPPLILDLGQTWRLLTANFVHRDALHLAFNLFVLFNVGGALENAFRPVQYVTVLLVSALGTTVLSLLASDAISAGASGVVFGCFGGLVVFGVKYREIIPSRYRKFFGAAVAPYVLVFLWMGWVSAGIDNWGHLGGLLGGMAATALLRPRLLVAGRPSGRWPDRVLWASLLCVAVAVTFAGPWSTKVLRGSAVFRDDISGVVMSYPKGWRRTVTSLGELGLGNGLPDPVWVQARYELVQSPVNIASAADRWLAQQLHQAEQAGRVRSSRWRATGETEVAGFPGIEYEAAFEAIAQDGSVTGYRLRLYAFSRGEMTYSVAVAGPERRFEAYAPLLRDMVEGMTLDEPRFVRHARAKVLLSPGDPAAQERLAVALRRAGL